MRGTLAGLVVLLLFSGCVGGDASDTSSSPSASATADALTGGIDGKILTDELQPIVGAKVGIVKVSGEQTSGADGSYAFSHLEPGDYTVIAGALGYYQGQRKVSVVAGEVASGDIILDKVPVAPPPYDEINKIKGNLIASDACQAGEFTPETKDVSWRDHPLVINQTNADGLEIAAVLVDVDVKSSQSASSVDLDLYLVDSAGKEIASSHSGSPDEHIEHLKYLPAGTYSVRVWSCTGANVDYTGQIKVTYEQGEAAQAAREGKSK